MNRREFLHPRQVAQLAGPVLALTDELVNLSEAAAEEAPSQRAVMLRFARRAMATSFEVLLPFGTANAHECAEAALDEIDRLESQLTVYRDSSEVSQLNRHAFSQSVRVESNLFQLLQLAQRIHRDTAGAFDISVGALIKCWGFYRRAGRVPSPEERAAACERIGMQHLVLDAQRQRVSYQRQGVEINLGSIGKGHALDCAAERMTQTGAVPSALLHGGNSSILAFGNEAPTRIGWTIGLLDPVQTQCRRGHLRLCNRAMATSAITYQQIEHEGRKLGHLLDPRTAWPAEGMLSATVTAPSAAEADALATAFFILGVEDATSYCKEHPHIGAALIAAEAPHRLIVLGQAHNEVEILR